MIFSNSYRTLIYTQNRRTGIEGELRARAFGDQSLFKTVSFVIETIFSDKVILLQVCGDIPENALYVDAVSVEDRTPWYEIKVRKLGTLQGIKIIQPTRKAFWHFWPNMGIFGPFDLMPDQKTMRTSCLSGFPIM